MIKIAIGLAAVVVGGLVLVALQPSEFRVERSLSIAAPRNVVFAKVNDFHQWDTWSPWAKLDPDAKHTFEGPASGTGAVVGWSGSDTMGEGRMTITESQPGELVRLRLDFKRPFPATNTAEFTFKPEGARTLVTWSMEGPKPFIVKAVSLVKDMDAMLGGYFDQGLANLRSVTEVAAQK
jgi:uncharacterized protein YndB with AHSA1/START domain